MQDDFLAQAQAWLTEDPDPDTRAELARLIDTKDVTELTARFGGTLQFGTAGLRGELGAAPLRMNRSVVIRAAAGLAAYLKKQGHHDGLVVIGYDARHKSADFARDTAAVMTGAGLRAALLPRPLPTPRPRLRHQAPRRGRRRGGHRQPQPAPRQRLQGLPRRRLPDRPARRHGHRRRDRRDPVPHHGVPPHRGLGDPRRHRPRGLPRPHGRRPGPRLPRTARTVYTAMHGVGTDVLLAAFDRAGFPAPTLVAEQADPDPDFPTVAFPNPEEPGAMDLAFATARACDPDLIIANDPDADRCAAAVKDAGDWRMLRGDEVGALLAAHLVARGARGTFAQSIVSSSLLGRIAEKAGLRHAETLTGFKWIARVDGLRYGYEEALGYCVDPDGVRDKDGITAALLITELASVLKSGGRTLLDLLDDLAVEHGLHATDQLSVRVQDLSVIADAMRRLREQPPARLGGLPVTKAEDLTGGTAGLPPTDGLRYTLDGARVIVRPSGTEPKLKCYLEVVVPVAAHADLPAARARATDLLTSIGRDLSDTAGL
ncbi:hypothetical protein GCM10020295_30240 [Streptomyces cinereospinus]